MNDPGAVETASERRAVAHPAGPCTLVIFGATGDLTHRLLTPALYNLSRWGLLPEDFAVIGVGVPLGRHVVTFRHPQLGERTVECVVTSQAPARVSVDLRK